MEGLGGMVAAFYREWSWGWKELEAWLGLGQLGRNLGPVN